MNVMPTAAVERAATPVPIHAALVLDPAFTNYRWSFSSTGDTWEYPMGGRLRQYAEEISRKILKEVTIQADATVPENAEVVLIA